MGMHLNNVRVIFAGPNSLLFSKIASSVVMGRMYCGKYQCITLTVRRKEVT